MEIPTKAQPQAVMKSQCTHFLQPQNDFMNSVYYMIYLDMSIWIKLDTIEIVIGYCHQHCINGSSVQPTPWPPEVLHFDPAKPLGTCTGGGRARIDWSSVIWPPSDSFDTQSFVNPSPTCCAIHHHDLGWTPKVSLRQKFPKSASRR